MPESYRESLEKEIELAVWEITETEAELRNGLALSEKARARLGSRKSELHRKGYLAIRQLLKKLQIDPLSHQYDEQGAPYLTDGRFISISHTRSRAAVAVGNIPVGVDLEFYQEKIMSIAPRFLHPEELECRNTTFIPYYTQLWTAKEAMYKVHNVPGIHFASQIRIHPFLENCQAAEGSVTEQYKKQDYSLYFRYFETYCLTLATPK